MPNYSYLALDGIELVFSEEKLTYLLLALSSEWNELNIV